MKFGATAIRFGKALLKLPQNTVIISDENIVGHSILFGSENIFSISSRILKQLETSLLKAAGLTPSMIAELKPCPPQNTSLTPVQLEFMRKINELGMTYRRTHEVADIVAANQGLFRK